MDNTTVLLLLIIGVLIIFIAIIFIVIIFTSISSSSTTSSSACFGMYGYQPGIDGTELNSCGTDGTDPCVFSMASPSASVLQCNALSSICSAFTYNSTTQTMKIINLNATFTNEQADLYVLQNCPTTS